MINKILIKLFKPKYIVMKGIRIENRVIMFIGKHPKFIYSDWGVEYITFKNRSGTYYHENIYKILWTKNQLAKWQKLTKSIIGSKCLTRKLFRWVRT